MAEHNGVVMMDGEFDVEVRQSSSKKGRGMFAKRDLKEGDVLFSESPLVSAQFVWNTVYQYSACDLCLRSLESAEEMCRRLAGNRSIVLPHPECCEVKKSEHVSCENCPVMYCSEACRHQAWQKYHRTLCMGAAPPGDQVHPISRLLEAWRQMHYPPESCSIMLIARMIASVKQAEDPVAAVGAFGQFCRATVNEEENMAHKLLGVKFQDQLHLLRNLLSAALYEEKVQQWFTPEGFQSLFALIGTNGQGIGTSSFSVWVKNCEALSLSDDDRQKLNDLIDQIYSDFDTVSGDFLDCEGSGLYALQSSCNHSCAPNAEVTFPNNNFVLSVKALKDIKQGEEIFISYLDECARDRSRHSRQKILRENYLFGCQCEKCVEQADDPDVTSEEEEDSDCMDDCDGAH